MKKAITIGLKANGRVEVLASPDVPFLEQHKKFTAYKLGDLPKGITAVEFYVRERATTGIDRAAEARRLKETEKAERVAPPAPPAPPVAPPPATGEKDKGAEATAPPQGATIESQKEVTA